MNKEKLVPKLRFEKFKQSETWKVIRLGENATFINGRAYSQEELLDNGKYKVLRVGNFYTNDSWYYSNFELNNKYYAEYGDLLYTWSASFGPHIWKGEKVIYHYHIWKIELNKKLDKIFLLQLLEEDKKQILSNVTGSTMVHITKSGMEEKNVIIPENIYEQQKIGIFFKKIDEMIQLQQLKVNKVKDIKSAYLSEMFPKEGEKYPKKRFEGFTEPWYKNKFNEITEYITSSLSANNTLIQGRYELYDANELIGYTNSSGQKQEYVTIIKDGSGVGRVRLLPKDSNFIGTMGAIVNKEQTDIHYIYAYLQQFNFTEFITGATVPHVYYRDYGESTAYHPSYEEQVKIGKLFNNLDNQISIEEEKLTKLEKLKQAYLNDMFI